MSAVFSVGSALSGHHGAAVESLFQEMAIRSAEGRDRVSTILRCLSDNICVLWHLFRIRLCVQKFWSKTIACAGVVGTRVRT